MTESSRIQPSRIQPSRPDELLRDLRADFAEVWRGAGVTLHEAHVIDAQGSSSERAAARLLDSEEHWWQVPDAAITDGWGYCALSFMDPAGLHYYLPAYLSWALRSGPDSPSATYEFTVYALASLEYRPAQFGLFTADQAATVCRVLAYLHHHDPDEVMAPHYRQALTAWTHLAASLKEPSP
jgi:hypothetical protein